ncbi:MAG: hypothetical protein IJV36_07400 [Prevotella sp.]|nr:hypothetical protein [Prevotella sp.]
MRRPVEIYQKKAGLLWLTAVDLGGAVLLTWMHFDELWPFTWHSVIEALFIAIMGITGLRALTELLSIMLRRDPYMLVYDDHIEMPRLLSRNSRMIYFCDVKEVKEDGEGKKTKILFYMQPYLKKSDLPHGAKFRRKFVGEDFTISTGSLDITGDEAYNMVLDRFLKYQQ